MRKPLLIVAAFAAGCAFADRTANREWVGRNFAPSNVVPRVKAVEDTLTDMEGKCLTTNLVGKTIVTGTNTVLNMGAGTRVNGTDDMFIRLGGGDLIFPDNLGIAVRGNRALATWGITNAYTKEEADAALDGLDAGLRRDLAPSNLVPRVEALENKPFPQKWATGNLTNANGVGLVDLKDKTTTIDAGERWTPSAKRESNWYTLAYGNGVFVAGNYSGEGLWYSSDGINWAQSNKRTENWYALAYGNGRFIANGSAFGTLGIWYSDDGKNWVQSSLRSGFWQGLAYGNGRFIAVKRTSGDVSSIQYSDDGINWSPSALSSSYKLEGVAYGNGRFVAGGFTLSSSDTGNGILYSDDGINWTRSSITSGGWGVIAYGNGVFIAGSNKGTGIWYSADGATWTQSTRTSGGLSGANYVNGRFIASASSDPGMIYSFDGINWTQGGKTSGYWYGFAYGNGRVVGLGAFTDGIWYSDPVEIKAVPVVQRIRVNGVELTADEDNVVDIPVDALKAALGIQ